MSRSTDPNISRLGLVSRPGTLHETSVFPPGSLRGAERPLVAQFPGILPLVCSVRSIPLVNTTIAAGSSAWYGIASWDAKDLGDQAVWTGYRAELGAMNPTPAADADYGATNLAAWGTTAGTGACVVVGMNLPCAAGQWASGPGNVPYVEIGAGPTQFAGGDRFYFPFPAGKLEDTPSPVVYRSSQTAPLAVLVTSGTRLDVALVVRRSQVSGLTKTDGILARILVELTLGKFYTNAEFSQ